ncbi:ACP synthase [Serinibacter arcticus]|uniref:ACP synthase n=1 Tax=Serinibacter arcticus TaxID=1655435 RepID=A0A2U1ZXQ7_9MICO|nr:phosphatase domain-containing protein [Serinibacter arcticus]PWD51775.1 ACP synthase [Serinibacter arcticus]
MADHVSRGPTIAASIEARLERRATTVLARRGWRPTPLVFDSYGRAAVDGEPGWVRLLCRVLVMPPTERRSAEGRSRGWRRYLSVSAPDLPVHVHLGDTVHKVRTEPGGYIDVRLPANLPPGRHEVFVDVPGGAEAGRGRIDVIDPAIAHGVVSDIDDTAMVTLLPSPVQAFWNTFVMHEGQRRPVPGMAAFLERESRGFIVYLSTGAWNYAPVIREFLRRHGYPSGALLMTDWGPSAQRWFRSGVEHKRTQLRRLREEFPELRWTLVGDDGQHDPAIYADFAAAFPDAVDTIAIRMLTPAEHLVTGACPSRPTSSPRCCRCPSSRGTTR